MGFNWRQRVCISVSGMRFTGSDALNRYYCFWENKARREGRRQDNISNYVQLVREGKTKAPIGDRHPEFMFTL